MATSQTDWQRLGPMPTDAGLEEALGQVKHENNHTAADESVWIERSRTNAAAFAAAEVEFFQELDKQTVSN